MNQAVNPYAAPTAIVDDIKEADALPLASRGSRLAAAIIDTIIFLTLVWGPLLLWFGSFEAPLVLLGEFAANRPVLGIFLPAAFGFAMLVIVDGYFLYRNGQTIGKLALGIKIVRSNGERATLGRLLGVRYLSAQIANSVPYIGGLLAIVNVLFIFRASHKCLHDEIADTVVIKA